MQKIQKEHKGFEEGSWGVEIFEGLEPSVGNGDVVVSKHWASGLVFSFPLKRIVGRNLCVDKITGLSSTRIWIISSDSEM